MEFSTLVSKKRMKKLYTEIIIIIITWLILGCFLFLFVSDLAQFSSPGKFILRFFVYFSIFLALFFLNRFLFIPKWFFHPKKKVLYFSVISIIGLILLFSNPFRLLMNNIRKDQMKKMQQFEQMHRRIVDSILESQHMQPPFHPNDDHMQLPPMHNNEERNNMMPPPRDDFHPDGRRKFHPDLISMFLYLAIIAIGITTEYQKKLNTSQQSFLQAASEKAKAELFFLKAQVNPHFLFNTLNNIYSMSVVQSEFTSEAIMRLSNIMRYITDTSEKEFVPLEDEINCIKDYVYLNQLRGGKTFHLDFEILGETIGKKIAPMLLLTFIENAFKYGLSKKEPSPIKIHLHTSENQMMFLCENRIFPNLKTDERKGLGIGNTKKRLDLIYLEDYQLTIDNDADKFRVSLILPV